MHDLYIWNNYKDWVYIKLDDGCYYYNKYLNNLDRYHISRTGNPLNDPNRKFIKTNIFSIDKSICISERILPIIKMHLESI